MADGYDRFDNEGGGGGSFVMGLLTGTVLGAGLGSAGSRSSTGNARLSGRACVIGRPWYAEQSRRPATLDRLWMC